jgi:hypothetical protein
MPSQPERIAAQLQRIIDIEDIKMLKYRYIRLVDAHRFDEWGSSCFTEDCYLSTTELGTWIGRDDIVAAVRRGYGSARTIHQVHMPEITMTGPDTATGIWSLSDFATWPAEGGPVIDWGRGHYEDSYVRTAQGWRIERTVLVRETLPAPNRCELMARNPA